jgi:ABC-2 type transport system permease protein
LLPSENVMQILGPILALLAFAGGLFVPLQFLDPTVQTLAKLTPAYGVGELARIPLTHDPFTWAAVLNIVVWLAIFVTGAAILFRRDTRRV